LNLEGLGCLKGVGLGRAVQANHLDLIHLGWRRYVPQACLQGVDQGRVAMQVDLDARWRVAHPPDQAQFGGLLPHPGPKAHPLHQPTYG